MSSLHTLPGWLLSSLEARYSTVSCLFLSEIQDLGPVATIACCVASKPQNHWTARHRRMIGLKIFSFFFFINYRLKEANLSKADEPLGDMFIVLLDVESSSLL